MNEQNAFIEGFKDGLRPDLQLTVSEWAEKNRILSSKSSSESGPWRNRRTPYMIEPMDHMSPHHDTEELSLMFGAQLGKTEGMLNATGTVMDIAPGPVMWVQPTEGMAKKFSKQRIDPLVRDTVSLQGKVSDSKSKDGSSSALEKDFTGGILFIVGANSSAGLASSPIRYLFIDEPDRYPKDVDGEGSPVDLARARTRNFSRRKIVMTSTPTTKGDSEIESAFLESDQRKYFVPCPHCKEKQVLEFRQLKWDKGNTETVQYFCIHCGEGIQEYHKTWMMSVESGAEWRATTSAKSLGKVGFFLNSLYSPVGWMSWQKIASDWEKAQGSETKLKAFVNTVLAESWVVKGEAPDWKRLYDQREDYRLGIVPMPVPILTMGVDVQGDRIEAHVIGWGRNKEKWTVDYQIIPGDTTDLSNKGPWNRVSQLIQKIYDHESGSKIRISATCIDSGHNTQKVYEFVRKHSHLKVYAIKGFEKQPQVVGSPKDVDIKTADGRMLYRGSKYWPVGINVIKPDIYGWLRREMPTEEEVTEYGYPTGYFHFPEMSEDWVKQLVSEQLVPVIIKGYKVNRWQKIYDRNEVLDTAVYAVAASFLLGLPDWNEDRWSKEEAKVGARPIKTVNQEIVVEPVVKEKKKKKERDSDMDDFELDFDLDF